MDRALGGDRHTERERERPFQRNHRTNPQPHRKQLQRNPRQQPPDPFKTFTLNFQSAIIPPDRLRTPTSPRKKKTKIAKDASRLLQRPSPQRMRIKSPSHKHLLQNYPPFLRKIPPTKSPIQSPHQKNRPTFREPKQNKKYQTTP